MNITLRKANIDDGELLLKWRNDPQVYLHYHNPEPVEREVHFRWFTSALEDTNRHIYIAEADGRPVGMIRFDADDKGREELSWAVDPTLQRKGIGTAMLKEARLISDKELVAEIKKENIGSIKMAESAGFMLDEENNGTLFYSSKLRK